MVMLRRPSAGPAMRPPSGDSPIVDDIHLAKKKKRAKAAAAEAAEKVEREWSCPGVFFLAASPVSNSHLFCFRVDEDYDYDSYGRK